MGQQLKLILQMGMAPWLMDVGLGYRLVGVMVFSLRPWPVEQKCSQVISYQWKLGSNLTSYGVTHDFYLMKCGVSLYIAQQYTAMKGGARLYITQKYAAVKGGGARLNHNNKLQ